MPIIGGHHVLALQSSPEGWQAPPLLERCREFAGHRGARGAAARAVPGRDQRHAGVGGAAVDRGFGRWRGAAADTVAVSGRPGRGAADGRLGRRRQTVGIASASATAVGGVLASAAAVGPAAAPAGLVRGAGGGLARSPPGLCGEHRRPPLPRGQPLVVPPEGLPLAYEVLPGNTADKTTLRGFLERIERQYGKARRVWLMDRGVPTEEVLAEMRAADPPVALST